MIAKYYARLAVLVLSMASACVAVAQIPTPKDVDGLTEMNRPIAISGQTVFTDIPGFGNATVHSYHRVANILQSTYVPLYFDVEFGKPTSPTYFKETYRVMYVTVPDQVVKQGAAPMPIPTPPFFGNFAGNVYLVGLCLNKNRSPNAPALTPWLEMNSVKLYTQ